MILEERLAELGLQLPALTKPLAAYIPARRHGDLLYVSGQLPMVEGKSLCNGALASEADVERAKAAARQCFLNALAAARTAVRSGDLKGVIRIGGFVASAPEFYLQPAVVNGASELAVEIFGEEGKHARAAVGVASLPLGVSVEVEVVFSLNATR